MAIVLAFNTAAEQRVHKQQMSMDCVQDCQNFFGFFFFAAGEKEFDDSICSFLNKYEIRDLVSIASSCLKRFLISRFRTTHAFD